MVKIKDKRVKNIEIIFENCETCVLDYNMFSQFAVNNVTRSISSNCFQYQCGEVHERLSCNFCMFVIKKEFKNKKMGFDNYQDSILEKRIFMKDVAGINIIYNNGTSEYILVPWCDDDEYINSYQYVKYDSLDGDIIVCISKNTLEFEEGDNIEK